MTARISFNEFMEFVAARGEAKLTRVRQALSMRQGDKYIKQDWWKALNRSVIECLQTGDFETFDRCLTSLTDERKRDGYTANVAGIRKWIGRKRPEYFAVNRVVWSAEGLEVSVNPELGLVIKGERYVVKLYFKEEKLDQRKVNPLLALLDATHGKIGKVAILDCRRSNLFTQTTKVRNVGALLEGEAKYFVHLWESLTGDEAESA